MTSDRRICLAACTLIAICGCSHQHQQDFQQTVDFVDRADLQGISAVYVETRNGNVDVACKAGAGQADISGTRYARARSEDVALDLLERIQITTTRDPAREDILRIVAEFPTPPPNMNATTGVSFRILLPTATAIDVRTCNGHATVNGAARPVTVLNANGPVHIVDVTGDVSVTTSNAPVSLEDIEGQATAISSNGSIELKQVRGREVRARTSNARLRAAGVAGATRLENSNGSIHAIGVEGDVTATTSNGQVTLENVAGDVGVVDSNGSIELVHVGRTQVAARTSNARIRAVDTQGMLRLENSNGSVELRTAHLPPDPRVHVATSNGSVRIELPGDLRSRLHCTTSNSRIHTSFGGRAQVGSLRSTRDVVSADLNGGGGLVEIFNSNGSIDLVLLEPSSALHGTNAP